MKKLLYTFLAVSIIFSACEEDTPLPAPNTNNNSNNTNLSIGDYHQGGVIFYLSGNGGGLICDIADIASTLNQVEWGCVNDSLAGAASTSIGGGFSNTTDIINGCNEVGYAAEICYNLTKAGYSDWYLPSKDELNEMYINKTIINATSISNGGYALNISDDEDEYWSSTQGHQEEGFGGYGLIQRFGDGHQKTYWKSNLCCARAIRSF
jgi:hypothetical protein